MKSIPGKLQKAAEFIAAIMLAAVFVIFLMQIFVRYVIEKFGIELGYFGWTLELSMFLWVWIVFFGGAFVVREHDHVKFDIFYLASPRSLRILFGLISSAAIAGVMLWSVPATWDYVNWMKIKSTGTLKIPTIDFSTMEIAMQKLSMRPVLVIIVIFAIALFVRYAWQFFHILRHGPHDDDHALVHEEEQK